MAQIKSENFTRNVGEVLGYPVKEVTAVSSRGTEYIKSVVEHIDVVLAGAPTYKPKDNQVRYEYPVFDPKTKKEFLVKVIGDKAVTDLFGVKMRLFNVSGGIAGKSVWFSADKIVVARKD